LPGSGNKIFALLAVLVVSATSSASSRQLSPEERVCISKKLRSSSVHSPRSSERDAFALMDPLSGRILWFENRKTLARRSFQPGSIFKVITTYAARSGLVDPAETFNCTGGDTTIGPSGSEVVCWLKKGHGSLNLAKALALSCNLYFAHIGSRIGTAPLLSAAHEFGLGQRTGSDLGGEVSGSLPSFPPDGMAARFATGQADGLRLTPLQALSAVAALANGGVLYSPRVANPQGGPTPVRGELKDIPTLRFIRDALEQASSYGTGRTQKLYELRLAGKTGTAAWDGVNWRTHAWYIGFAPCRHPLLSLVVFTYEGTGSKEAAALARKVIVTAYQAMKDCGVSVMTP
jgi:cell division protein FtsI/penicillin-binding protein 2